MKKLQQSLSNALVIFFFCLISLESMAQETSRVFKFETGESYQTDILTNSRAIIQRGKQSMNVNTNSLVSKSYTSMLNNDQGSSFTVKIKSLDAEIEAMGQRLRYNSGTKIDTSSRILEALDFMVNKPVDVSINKYGVIQNFTDYKAEMATDTLVSFAGLQPEAFEKGTMLGILADFNYSDKTKKGFNWKDSVNIDGQKLITDFWIEDISEKITILKFSSKISTSLLNTNQNGTYVIDNTTGIIQEKLLYSISTGYQISAGGVIYAVSRSTSVSEKTRKIN
ncbi:MAG: hypothetical protein EOO99_00545 [Pedobacter sp.]|nr:MAG: hypothetical protein EOO99_00545 [Pedobacter sp.]